MKRLLLISSIIILIAKVSNCQPNSVQLKDGNGSIISKHNTIQSANGSIPINLTHAYIIEITSSYTGIDEIYPIAINAHTGIQFNKYNNS